MEEAAGVREGGAGLESGDQLLLAGSVIAQRAPSRSEAKKSSSGEGFFLRPGARSLSKASWRTPLSPERRHS